MLNPAIFDEIGAPAGTRGAQAEVCFLEIEEKFFVKAADLVEHVLADHQAGPRQPIDRLRGLGHGQGHGGIAQEAADRADPRRALKFTQD